MENGEKECGKERKGKFKKRETRKERIRKPSKGIPLEEASPDPIHGQGRQDQRKRVWVAPLPRRPRTSLPAEFGAPIQEPRC